MICRFRVTWSSFYTLNHEPRNAPAHNTNPYFPNTIVFLFFFPKLFYQAGQLSLESYLP